MLTPIFSLDRITFHYPGAENLFQDLSLEITPGDSVCLLGANGSGKSTLLKMFCGLVFPSAGCIRAFGQEITERLLEDNGFARQYHRRVGFIFQNSEAQLFNSRV
ncbi:MAG: ATP-binding cassette domain-containing protein, partial [Bacillota bacterium]